LATKGSLSRRNPRPRHKEKNLKKFISSSLKKCRSEDTHGVWTGIETREKRARMESATGLTIRNRKAEGHHAMASASSHLINKPESAEEFMGLDQENPSAVPRNSQRLTTTEFPAGVD